MNEWWWENRYSLIYLLLLPVVAVGAMIFFDVNPFLSFLLGLMSGVGLLASLVAFTIPPLRVGNWRRGAEGEASTAIELEKLNDLGWKTVHDRALGRKNVDHVLVGPGGVLAIDSKNWSGMVEIVDGVVRRDGFAQPRLPDAARRTAAQINRELKSSTSTNPWVQAVIVLWADFPQNHLSIDNVTYVAGDTLSAWLYSLETKLSRQEIEEIAGAIERMPDGVELGAYG